MPGLDNHEDTASKNEGVAQLYYIYIYTVLWAESSLNLFRQN